MGDVSFDQIKTLLDQQGEAFEQFKASHETALAAERREREDLELRLQRLGFGGSDAKRLDPAPEYKALNGFVRNGPGDWTQDTEIKAMSVGSDPDGGYLVLPALSQGMTTRLHDISPMRRLARVEVMAKGDVWAEPDDRDEAGASWVGEAASRPATDSPQLGMIEIPLHEIYAMPVATQRLLDDASRDLGSWLERKIADKFARTEGEAFVSGDGVLKPRGLLTYEKVTTADATRPAGKLQYVPGGHASTMPTANPADVLKTLVWTLRKPYRNGATWLMNSATASAIDKIKNGAGDYIWRDGMTLGAPPSLLGYPVEIDEEMPDIGADAFPIAFGNFKLGYCIVDRPGIKLLRDPYTNKPHVNFYAYTRVGGGVTNDDAIKLLKIAEN